MTTEPTAAGELLDLATLPPPSGQPVDFDAIAADYLADARKRSALTRFQETCPEGMRSADTRWDDPRLLPNADAIAKVKAWRPSVSGKGLLATGPTGRGKTRSLFALWEALADDGVDVRYYHAADWFDHLEKLCRYGRDDAREWVHAVAMRPLVFIDDYGQEAVQRSKEDWARGWWFRFLDLRVERALPLLITTNMDAKRMAQDQGDLRGDPLVRRLLDLAEPVKFV